VTARKGIASLEYDGDAGVMYLRLAKGKVASSQPLADNMVLDVDEKGAPLGLELLLPRGMEPEVKAKFLKAV
jgi:uncharacterized protein YuzE